MSDALALSSFPQSGANRTRLEAISELAEHVGKQSDQLARSRAGRSLDAAVRDFNSRPWRFNRLVQDITLVLDTSSYTIATDWRNPLKALHLDANDKEVDFLDWIPFTEKIHFWPSELTSSSIPSSYTARNVHEIGTITYYPPIIAAGTLQYPKVRHYYHRRVLLVSGDGDRLNVPLEVDEAIFQLALAKFIQKERGSERAGGEYALAARIRRDVEREHGDWADYLSQGYY